MKWFLDISVLLLILTTVIMCAKKGFLRSVLGAAKTVIALILTFCFSGRVSLWLDEHVVGHRVFSYVYDRFTAMFEGGEGTVDLSHILNNIPNWLRVLLESMGVDVSSIGGRYAGLTDTTHAKLEEMAHSFADPISSFISDLLAYALVFLISLLVLTLLAYLLGKIAELPVIRTCDRLLGFALGVVCAILYASVYTVLLFAVLSMVEGSLHSFAFHDAFEQTVVFRQAYEYNLFRWIFGIG